MAETFNSTADLLKSLSPELIWNILVAIITAFFTVQISLRKFSTQKWWERREQTYSEIVGILSSLLVSIGNWEEDVLKIRKLDEEERKKLFSKLQHEKEKIELLAREGAFRISKKSNEALHTLVKSLNQYGEHEMEGIEIQWKAISECLGIITQEAEKDLGLKKKWYKPWTYFA